MTTKTAPASTPDANVAAEAIPHTGALVRVGPDWRLLSATASQPFRLTSAVLTVNGEPVSIRKGQMLPMLRLSPAQCDDLRAALRDGTLTVGSAAALDFTPSVGRGRPRVTGMDADALAAFVGVDEDAAAAAAVADGIGAPAA